MSVLDETTRIAPIPAEDRPRTCPGRPATLRSPKILDRLAVVYIRHSDPQQVLKHRESRERQYALADHAVAPGLARGLRPSHQRPGLSGRSAYGRGGFQRLLA
ncbi:MAG: hypothetical protein ACLQGP_29945 [Isosphaeraceae bacterium]